MREIFIFIIQIQTRTQYNYDLIPPNSFYKVLKFVMGGGLCLISEEEETGAGGLKSAQWVARINSDHAHLSTKRAAIYFHTLTETFLLGRKCCLLLYVCVSSSQFISGNNRLTLGHGDTRRDCEGREWQRITPTSSRQPYIRGGERGGQAANVDCHELPLWLKSRARKWNVLQAFLHFCLLLYLWAEYTAAAA